MKTGNDLLKRLIQLLSELFKMMPGRGSAQFAKLAKLISKREIVHP